MALVTPAPGTTPDDLAEAVDAERETPRRSVLRDGGPPPAGTRPPGRLPLLLAVASALLMLLDAGAGSPLDPVRAAVGTALTPVESAAAGAVRPLARAVGVVHTNDGLRDHVAALEAQNSDLRGRLTTSTVDQRRLAEYDGLVATARRTGYTLVPTRVVGIGPAQSFQRTVTLDAGSAAGIVKDSTVVNKDGLVGRVVRVTRDSATVLLLVDRRSVVGGRLGSTMKIGFLHGRGTLGAGGRLDLDLVDDLVRPTVGDVVVSWGSGGGGPYVAGIPIGTVESVSSSPRDSARRAAITPSVDFSALDLVGVVVPGTAKGSKVSDQDRISGDQTSGDQTSGDQMSGETR